MANDLLKTTWINKDNGHHVVMLKNRQLNSTKCKLTTVYYLADLSTHKIIGTAPVENEELAVNMMFNTLESAGIEFEIEKGSASETKELQPNFVSTPLGDGPSPAPITVHDDLSKPNKPHIKLT